MTQQTQQYHNGVSVRITQEIKKQCLDKSLSPQVTSEILEHLNLFAKVCDLPDNLVSDYISKVIDDYLDVSANALYQHIEGYDVGIPVLGSLFDFTQSDNAYKYLSPLDGCKVILQFEPDSSRTDCRTNQNNKRAQTDLISLRHFHVTVLHSEFGFRLDGSILETFCNNPADLEETMQLIDDVYASTPHIIEDFDNALIGQCTDIHSANIANEAVAVFESLLVSEGTRGAIAYTCDVEIRDNRKSTAKHQDLYQLAQLSIAGSFDLLQLDRVSLSNTHNMYVAPKKQSLSALILNSAIKELMSPRFRKQLITNLREGGRDDAPIVFKPLEAVDPSLC